MWAFGLCAKTSKAGVSEQSADMEKHGWKN